MKITPLEIRQKSFEKAFRGLDKDEVTAFLATLSTEWEKLQDENKELIIKLEASQKEVEKLREVENSLFKTLKTAEDTGANMIDQATKSAELHMKETEMKAEALLNEAKNKARDLIEQSEMKSKSALEEMEDRLRSMAQVYRTLENVREDLLSDIKTFANEAIEKTNRVISQLKKIDIDEELMKIKREGGVSNTHKLDFPLDVSSDSEDIQIENIETVKPVEVVAKPEPKNDESIKDETSKSFFDDLE